MIWLWSRLVVRQFLATSGRGEASDRRRSGSVTAELAILLPVLLVLAFGALEFGRIFDAWVVATAASREGARQAALGVSASSVKTQVVLPYLQASGLAGDVTITLPTTDQILVNPQTGLPGESVTVYVPVWIEVETPIVNRLLPANPMKVGAFTTVRRQ
jgi:Flp pilus assembly protein TadG